MDVSSVAAAMIGAKAGRTQMAVATKMLKMSIDSEASVLQLLQPGQGNAAQAAASGVGQNVDISV
jgi:hypothetical protein